MNDPSIRLLATLSLLALGATTGHVHHAAPAGRPPHAPEQSLAMTDVAKGLKLELFAAEPLVADPVAMEIDEDGRIYVALDRGYPHATTRTSAIVRLDDTDGDGRPDARTIFADGLRMPRGVMRWRKGLLVTDAPDLLYLEDTDGDGRADVRRVLLTGFGTGNPQLGVNNPVYGLDNRVYVAHMSAETELVIVDADGTRRKGPDIRRRSFRFDPETRTVEPLSAATQFGHAFDAWGSHLLTSNANHLYEAVVEARYLERNPDLLVASLTHSLPAHGAAARVFALAEDPGFQLFTDHGVITSACGLTCYLGGAFPPSFEGVTVVAEPSHNLVHADVIENAGGAHTARRLLDSSEVIASRDGWFRPVNFHVGPDGALYVLDFYRAIVEQPKFLSPDVIAAGGLYAGSDLGRIYRLVPEGGLPFAWAEARALGRASTPALVDALQRPNIWWRRHAQRLLVDRRDPAAIAPLARLVREATRAEARLHALWTLEGVGALDADLITLALGGGSPGVRRNAVLLAERHLARRPALAAALIARRDDPDAGVRFQLLLTLGGLRTPGAAAARDAILFRDLDDPWVHIASLTAADAAGAGVLESAIARLSDQDTPARRAYFARVGGLAGARPNALGGILRQLADPAAPAASAWWRRAALEGLAERLRRSDLSALPLADERERLARTALESRSPELAQAALSVLLAVGLPPGATRDALDQRAAVLAADRRADAEARATAIRVLAISGGAARLERLQGLVDAREPAPVQKAAVEALGARDDAAVGRFLVDRVGALTPAVREAALDALLRSPDRVVLLLDAVEAGRVSRASIDWIRTKRLMLHPDAAIQARARALLVVKDTSSAELVSRYSPALTGSGDPARGAQVFAALCSACHQVDGAGGQRFGPDLATVRSRSPESILVDTLLPSREIAAGYELWSLTMAGGDALAGVIAAETPTSVTVRLMGGAERTIERAGIASMEAVGVSAMPAGFEQQIDPPAMAHLLAFLRRPH